jgi:hypothetical protein
MNKKLVLLLTLCIPLALTAQDSRVAEWAKLFYIDAKLDQSYLNGIASFICYLMEKEPSEKRFNKEFKKVRQSFKDAPNYFQQSLVRLYSNSYSQAYKTSANAQEPNHAVWQDALMSYYHSVYPLLDASHKTISYGAKKGMDLPQPNN